MFNRIIKIITPLALMLVLSACTSEVYSNLNERDANEMVQVLSRDGIDAERSVSADGKYSISVSRGDFSRALSQLSANGLPRKDFGSLGQVFNSEKLVSTPFEERARFMHAMNEELSKSLTEIDGVLSARVLINLPEANNAMDRDSQSPRASVFIYQAEGADLRQSVPTIKNLVVNSVHNLDYSAVTVALFNASSTPNAASQSVFRSGSMNFTNLIGMVLLGLLALFGLKFAFSGNGKGKSDKTLRDNARPTI